MELVHEMTLRCVVNGGVVTPGPGPLRHARRRRRCRAERSRGERINGTMHGAGADWLLIGSDGYGRVDVRGQIVTDDGAAIYVQYFGLLEMNKAVGTASIDPTAETGYGDQYFRITPRFETGDDGTRGSTRRCSSPRAGSRPTASNTRCSGSRDTESRGGSARAHRAEVGRHPPADPIERSATHSVGPADSSTAGRRVCC